MATAQRSNIFLGSFQLKKCYSAISFHKNRSCLSAVLGVHKGEGFEIDTKSIRLMIFDIMDILPAMVCLL